MIPTRGAPVHDTVVDAVALVGQLRRLVAGAHDDTVATQAAPLLDALVERIHQHARHDAVTALPNRAAIQERIDTAARRARREGTQLAVLLFDIDHFRHVNEALGHATGDRVLISVADRVFAHLRGQGMLARLGGDEFAVVLEDLARPAVADVQAACDGLLRSLARPMAVDGRRLRVTSSLGFVISDGREGAGELLRAADVAMRAAKSEGRGRWVQHTDELTDAARNRFAVHEQLLAALDDGGIEVHYQPIVELESGTPVGTEALARLRDPDGNVQLPAHFLEVAERQGLVGCIGAEVLAIAARDSASLPGWLSVNVSPSQLADDGFEPMVLERLTRSGLDPHRLVLEVTESVMLQAADATTIRNVVRLRAAGVRFALDDFGSGYSSLDRLRHLPVSFIKIDRAFVDGLTTVGSGDLAVVRAVVGMAGSLGIPVVAEAVEDELQRGVLLRAGVQLAQGHLFARAAPLPDPVSDSFVSGVSVTGRR